MIPFAYKNAQFSVPDDFADATQIAAIAPAEKGARFATNVVLTQSLVKPGTTVEAFASAALSSGREVLPNMQAPVSKPAKFGSHSGILLEQRLSQGSQQLAQLQFIVLVATTAYCMTFTCLASELERLRPLAQQIFATLKVK